jgi:aryl-alcohol dehydrogenase-like predicted oxidoreductase
MMLQNSLGRTGRTVSTVGLGTWQLGSDWGDVDDDSALEVLRASVDAGVTFCDTADVYGDGHSEEIIGRYLRENASAELTVATQMGRRGPQDPGEFTLKNFRAWTDRSRRNLGVETLDLVQLHCPPTPVFSSDTVYDDLDVLVAEGGDGVPGAGARRSGAGPDRQRVRRSVAGPRRLARPRWFGHSDPWNGVPWLQTTRWHPRAG